MEIQIDEEFKALIPPLTTVEYAQLEDNIQREGCRDALMLWKGTGILVDGHNRYEICEREQLDFRTVEIPFESREKAIDWICMNQLGRRNLSPVDATMLRGRMYEMRKKEHGGQLPKGIPQNEGSLSTAEIVAKETGVSRATVERAAEFVKAIDKVATVVPDVLAKVRKGETSKGDVIAAAKIVESDPVQAVEILSRPHVSNNSGNNEWYTPPEFIESARLVLGKIRLDPASSEIANGTVKATTFFTAADDGLSKKWPIGSIWMNPPYAQPLMSQFADKFADEIMKGSTGIALVNNATETKWFQRIAAVCSAICFPLTRIRFLDPDGNPGAPLQGQAIVYCGQDTDMFISAFSQYGLVVKHG